MLEDVFDLQERLSRRIVGGLDVALASGEEERLRKRSLGNAAAYDCYLRAFREISELTESALDRARQHLEAALEMVGDDALLYAGLARVYAGYYTGYFRTDPETARTAERFARKAIELDPDVVPAHTTLAGLALCSGDLKQGYAHSMRALPISPSDSDAVLWLVHAACPMGRTVVSRPFVERLVRTDPLNSQSHLCMEIQAYYEGRFEESVAAGRAANRLDPQSLWPIWLAFPLAVTQRTGEAWAVLEPWRRDSPQHSWVQGGESLLYAAEGKRTESLRVLGEMLTNNGLADALKHDAVGVLMVAEIYALNRETDEVMKWLAHGLAMGIANYPFLAEKDPCFEYLRSEPRFQEFLARVKRAWEDLDI